MTKAVILTNEEASTILKALYLYLSAENKEERQEASVIGKEAFKILRGSEYETPESEGFKELMLHIL